jgi:hypothetical protein
MPQPELLKRVVDVLAQASVEYAVTGSVASSIQGEPRSTHDVDLIVALTSTAIPTLVAAFAGPEFVLQEQAIRDAIRTGTMFNLLWITEGDKVDFWMLRDEPFDRSRFARRRVSHAWEMELMVTSPEDTILAKLRWSKQSGGSERQYLDALRIYEIQHGILDHPYLDQWANTLGVTADWERLKAQAKPVRPALG